MSVPNPLLDDERAALLEGFISVTVGSRNEERVPSVGRALGCRILRHQGRVVVFLPRPQCEALLADLETTRAIAVVFSMPESHRTLQFKGTDAEVGLLGPGDWECIERYRDTFATRLDAMGYPELTIRTLLACPASEVRAVTFTPAQAFDQTPGPAAGQPLEVRP